MPVQPQLFPDQEPQSAPPALAPPSPKVDQAASAPVWLQRMSLFVLVLFCVYLGVLVMVLPWWPRMWDQNMFIDARPQLASILHNGAYAASSQAWARSISGSASPRRSIIASRGAEVIGTY